MTDTPGLLSYPPPEPSRIARVREFFFRVGSKALEDNIFFMAGAITFNFLVALVPILLLFVGISGFVLTSRFPDPSSALIEMLVENLPAVEGMQEFVAGVDSIINTLVEDRASFSVAGFLIFLWISTRLVGTLRTVLREVFDLSHGRGIIQGKIFDGFMVVVGGLLFVVNLGITVMVSAAEDYGLDLVGLQGPGLNLVRQFSAQLLAFGSIWALFLMVYRYLPPRRIPIRKAIAAATFMGVLFEVSKSIFSWYVTSVADFRSAYGGLTSVAVLFFWIYYGAIVFILGGEVAQVYDIHRTRRIHASTPMPGGER